MLIKLKFRAYATKMDLIMTRKFGQVKSNRQNGEWNSYLMQYKRFTAVLNSPLNIGVNVTLVSSNLSQVEIP
jgi:hypothetical protein